MTVKATISFCCNDGSGHFTGRFGEMDVTCHFRNLEADVDMKLVATDDDGDTLWIGTDSIIVAGHEYPIDSDSRLRYQGNLCWDSVSLDRSVARQVVKYLLSGRNFDVEQIDDTHPFEDLCAIPERRRSGTI